MKLQKFIITKLNGYQNVEIHIENNRKILVAENGSGKTTILNILFCCLKLSLKSKHVFFSELV